MNETYIKRINSTKTITESLPKIIEAFVMFYGEEERENIINKFKNLIIIGYYNPDELERIIRKSDKEANDKLINEFINQLTHKEEEKVLLKDLFISTYDINDYNYYPIARYKNYITGKDVERYNKQMVVKFLKNVNEEVTFDNLDELISNDKFKNIDTIFPKFEQLLEKINIYQENIKPYKDYMESTKNLKKQLVLKYEKEFIEEIKDLFSEEEYQDLIKNFEDKYINTIIYSQTKSKKIRNYISSLETNSKPLISSFSKKNEEILLNEEPWKADEIKYERIRFFNNLGIKKGDNYEDYINDPKIQELIPTEIEIERIIDLKTKIHEKLLIEYYTSLPEYQKNIEKIKQLDLINKAYGYSFKSHIIEKTCVSTNLKMVDGQITEYPILQMYMGTMSKYYDATLIHELNHAYELKLQNFDGNNCKFTCGWEYLEDNIIKDKPTNTSIEKNNEKRSYEYFNEIINELISQEISQIMTEQDLYVFNTKEDKKITWKSSYEQSAFIVRNFYNKYKKEIIESRKDGNINIILETVGKENFEQMNELIKEFHKTISPSWVTLCFDVNNQKETELVKKYLSFKERAKNIDQQMEEYSTKRSNTL